MSAQADIDPGRFAVHTAGPRGFRQAYVREGAGGVPLVCVHGWPESKRIFWRVIEPLAAAGFDVVVPATSARTASTTWPPTGATSTRLSTTCSASTMSY